MDRLLFFFGSTILTVLIIYLIPLGLNKKEKIALAVASTFIALFGLFSSTIVPLWQVLLLMISLSGAVGFIVAPRIFEAGTVMFINEIDAQNEESNPLSEKTIGDPYIEIQEENPNLNALQFVAATSEVESALDMDEDISFLDARDSIQVLDMNFSDESELPLNEFERESN